ncbi:MarR family winged helix-turn-helix transcriptional regulator [Planctomycetota bacterium]
MTANQFVLLALLMWEDGITQQELGQRAFSDPNTIRVMLVLLEKRGLLERMQCQVDYRKRIATITDKGRDIFEKLWNETEPSRRRFLTIFSVEEIEIMIKKSETCFRSDERDLIKQREVFLWQSV